MVITDGQKTEFGFLVTKPLQLLIVLALIEQLPKSITKEILIIDYFEDAKGVSERLTKLPPPNCIVLFFKDEAKAYKWAHKKRYAKLFIDSDVGFKSCLTLINLAINSNNTILAVYEEGLGTYRHDLYSGFKKKSLKLLGCGVYFGGNWLVKELYIYHPDDCNTPVRALKIKIKKNIITLLQENKNRLELIFNATDFFEYIRSQKDKFKECVIYLSNWRIDQNVINGLKDKEKLLIIKPHPHIKSLEILQGQAGLICARASIPAEMVIAWASTAFLSVKIIHHGSSTERYFNNEKCEFYSI